MHRSHGATGYCGRLLVVAALLLAGIAVAQDDDTFRRRRLQMVEDAIVREGITNKGVIGAMQTVPRHLFVAGEFKDRAYFDQALAIGHKQTISPPYIVAYMTQVIDPQETDTVLEIGTGSGYQAAVLSGLVKEVYSIEIVEPLGNQAAERLRDLGYTNVRTKVGDGYQGWKEYAPFDKIIVTCSPEDVPQPLVEQLKEGGKMIIPLGERYQQVFCLFEKQDGKLTKKELLPTLFVPMTGVSEDNRKILPDPLKPEIRNGSFEEWDEKAERAGVWHYQRQMQIIRKGAPAGGAFAEFENHDPGRYAHCLQGMAIDGRRITSVRTRLWVRGVDIRPGQEKWERAMLMIQFYDGNRKPVGESILGPWDGTFTWKQVSQDLAVPPAAREAVVLIGLSGATGTLSVDNIQITPKTR